uniref:B30.2/SPRY domain-containing protein n=1 Tax=Ciona savignyi TaxID=51511 RepID=H2ZLJ4_CIOSA
GQGQKVGCFIMSSPLSEDGGYFEVEIISTGVSGEIAIGLAPYEYDLESMPGWKYGSIAYHADSGDLFKCSGSGSRFGPRCRVGDRMGCGVRPNDQENYFNTDLLMSLPITSLEVYFTKNGEEVGWVGMFKYNAGQLHPVIGMTSSGESVRLTTLPEEVWRPPSTDDLMHVDGTEEDWLKMHDVKITGQVIEYNGNGVDIHDVGLAQARHPLNTTNHYFEIEILEPGQHCYIAIGLTHKNYPLHRHPGWNMGSIAYHADDGKIFLGKGQGTLFGPRSYRGDVIGCGVEFPWDYTTPSDGEDEQRWFDVPLRRRGGMHRGLQGKSPVIYGPKGMMVKVFFTRNGVRVGFKEVMMPRGGFYPAIGMLSADEKVRVDLRPMTG